MSQAVVDPQRGGHRDGMQSLPTDMAESYIPKYRLETQAQVCARVGLASSTISARRNPSDPTYDPGWPEAIPVGPPSDPYSSIRFAAHEVDEWIESRMTMRPGRQLCPRCTNATTDSPIQIPRSPPIPINKTRRIASE